MQGFALTTAAYTFNIGPPSRCNYSPLQGEQSRTH
jgi:hypothetical protein